MSSEQQEGKCICRRGIDYYGVLSVNKNSTDLEIKDAFRRLAIRFNPARQKERDTSDIFALVSEAYDVLSDPFRRTIYDRYGEEGLKRGVPELKDCFKPYIYHGDPMRTYREFFGTESPYGDLPNILTRPQPLLEFPEGRGIKRQEQPLIKTLQLTLPEIYFGGVKKMKIQKLVLAGDDKSTTVSMEKILTIPIKPGMPCGTRIVFPKEGDQGPAKIPADIVFVTEDRAHETFRREGSDLHMTVDIFLREALTGTVVTVNTVDDRTLRIPITSIVTPDYKKIVKNEGMPLPENPKNKGDLIISFNVEFPVYLPVSSKNYVRRALNSSSTDVVADAADIHRLILADKMRRNVDKDVPLRRGLDEANLLKFICRS